MYWFRSCVDCFSPILVGRLVTAAFVTGTFFPGTLLPGNFSSSNCCLQRSSCQADEPTAGVTLAWAEDESVEIYRLNVSPAGESRPAFRYRLRPRGLDRQPGNATPFYYRAMREVGALEEALHKEFGDDYDSLSTVSDAELNKEKLRQAVALFADGSGMHALRTGSLRQDCDWDFGIELLRGMDVVYFLLPELQDSRSWARLLALKTRSETADGRFDVAAATLQLSYQLASDIARPRTLVNGLVGLAQTAIANQQVIFWIGQPESPNLYWGLASISPLIDLSRAAQFELENGYRVLPFLADAESVDRTPQEWARLLAEGIDATLGELMGERPRLGNIKLDQGWKSRIAASGLLAMSYPEAKRELIAAGVDPSDVERMPTGQVVTIHVARVYEYIAGELEKMWFVPFDEWQQWDHSDELFRRPWDTPTPVGHEFLPLGSALFPAINAVRIAQMRYEREIASLMVVEAIRMHLAANSGKLPSKLDEIGVVPVPMNPATRKPFVYRLDGDVAILELPISDGLIIGRRYEIRVRK